MSDAALAVVDDLMNSRMEQFRHVARHELPVLYEDFSLGEEARAVLEGYVKDLENWLSGILVWHRECKRYGAADLRHGTGLPRPAALLGGPTGPGTAAARIALSV